MIISYFTWNSRSSPEATHLKKICPPFDLSYIICTIAVEILVYIDNKWYKYLFSLKKSQETHNNSIFFHLISWLEKKKIKIPKVTSWAYAISIGSGSPEIKHTNISCFSSRLCLIRISITDYYPQIGMYKSST